MLLPPAELEPFFGAIDVYLFDQLLKGRFSPGMRILDAGTGSGRNLPYFLRHGFDVCAVDGAAGSVTQVRALAKDLAPEILAAVPLEPLKTVNVENVRCMTTWCLRKTPRASA